MKIIIAATAAQRKEWGEASSQQTELVWVESTGELSRHTDADACIDLLFENDPAAVHKLKPLQHKLIFVNSVVLPLSEISLNAVRINAWPGFLSGPVEAAAPEALQNGAEKIFAALGKQPCWLPDVPGFVSARVISMIINEAWFALDEGVSTKEEINTAMKLGTAYPYGPFEWGEKIGLKNITALLNKLAVAQPRYRPAPLLLKEAGGG